MCANSNASNCSRCFFWILRLLTYIDVKIGEHYSPHITAGAAASQTRLQSPTQTPSNYLPNLTKSQTMASHNTDLIRCNPGHCSCRGQVSPLTAVTAAMSGEIAGCSSAPDLPTYCTQPGKCYGNPVLVILVLSGFLKSRFAITVNLLPLIYSFAELILKY